MENRAIGDGGTGGRERGSKERGWGRRNVGDREGEKLKEWVEMTDVKNATE